MTDKGYMAEFCGCGENTGKPVDLDGDGIAEWCQLCGDYYTLRWVETEAAVEA